MQEQPGKPLSAPLPRALPRNRAERRRFRAFYRGATLSSPAVRASRLIKAAHDVESAQA